MLQVPDYTEYGVLRGYKYVDKIVRDSEVPHMLWVYYKGGDKQVISEWALNTMGSTKGRWREYLE